LGLDKDLLLLLLSLFPSPLPFDCHSY
jgi:hypothetical protein